MRRYTREEFARVFDNVLGELLPGATPQGIEELSTSQRYEIGSRMQIRNKVFHYAFVGEGATGLQAGMGAKIRNQQDIAFNAITAAGAVAAGSWSLLVPIAATDGPAQNGSFPENYLRGGTIVVRPPGTNFNRGIVSHPAKAAGAGTLLLQLDAPTPVDVLVTNQIEGIASPYANVVFNLETAPDTSWQAMVGIPMIDAPAGYYTWLQTWGPCAAIGELTVGAAVDQRAVYCRASGGLDVFATDGGIGQYVGYVMAAGAVPNGQGAPFVFLQLDP